MLCLIRGVRLTRAIRLVLVCLVFLALSAGILHSTRFTSDLAHFSFSRLLVRAGLVLLALAALARAYWLLSRSPAPECLKKLALVPVSLLCLALVLEGAFTFLPRSFGTGIPLAERNWFAYYWGHVNGLGYRDREVDSAVPAGIMKIAVLGDSIVAGHGVKDVRLRFSDLLAERLGPGYRVYNLGTCGSDTRDELARLKRFPVTPDLVILAHYDNDIAMPEAAPAELILSVTRDLDAGARFMVERSYLANYLFWRFVAPGKIFERYVESAECVPFFSYLDKESFRRHKETLGAIQNWCGENRIEFLPVLFPELGMGITFSEVIVNQPLAAFFRNRGTTFLNVYPLVKDLPQNLRTVNRHDQHPSPLVHARVAEAIYRVLEERGVVVGE